MDVQASQLTLSDVDAVDSLMKSNSSTLGFLPKEALEDYIRKDGCLGVKDDGGELMGYILYGNNPAYFRVAQLCVSEKFRGRGVAARLMNGLKASATTQTVIKLNCRNDFPAHRLRPKLGFVAIGEKPGRSRQGFPLTHWVCQLARESQLSLLRANPSDDILDVVVDAQVFIGFYERGENKAIASKALLSDSLADSLRFWITDELRNDIARSSFSAQRDKRRAQIDSGEYAETLRHDPHLVDEFAARLEAVLPRNTDSARSDIRHLAKTASSDVSVFVTLDDGILKRAKAVYETVGVRAVSPVELITQVHEISESQSYAPDSVSGINLAWRRLTSGDIASFPYDKFAEPGERHSRLKEKMTPFLAKPNEYECQILRSGETPVAFRVLGTDSEGVAIHMGRVARHDKRSGLFGRHLVIDALHRAVANSLNMVKVERDALPAELLKGISDMGFTQLADGGFVKFCFARCLERDEALSEISALIPEVAAEYGSATPSELERRCSPMLMKSPWRDNFIIPIKSGYALSLVDSRQSSQMLIGGESPLLLWDNAYYRTASFGKMLRAPSRVLWYVSAPKKEIVAVSQLDEIRVDSPRELFKKYRGLGILKWEDIFALCGGDTSKKIMALRFSHTYPLRGNVSLDDVRRVYAKREGKKFNPVSPRRASAGVFEDLYRMGFAC